jgi:hypothetical protein
VALDCAEVTRCTCVARPPGSRCSRLTVAGHDEALIRNIARAHLWFERIRAGHSFDEVARETGTSKRRIQHIIGLAFLAPDILRDVLGGEQPAGFTSDWCKSHELPSDWAEQRALLATL